MTKIGPRDVLDFWFTETPSAKWFASDPAFDAEIRSRFEADVARSVSPADSRPGKTNRTARSP